MFIINSIQLYLPVSLCEPTGNWSMLKIYAILLPNDIKNIIFWDNGQVLDPLVNSFF